MKEDRKSDQTARLQAVPPLQTSYAPHATINPHFADRSFVMRSNQIHRALAHGMNRFEVCQLVSKGVKATHKTGSRFEDSINDVLQYLGTHETPLENLHPTISQVSMKSLKPAA